MSYIGRGIDKISNIEKLDTITFDGSSSYTLQKNSVNFTPSSANNLQVSIDGVVQAGNFTVSGSTIDFGTAVSGTSTNDFIFHYGTGLITTPADGTVTTAKLADASVTSAKLDAGKVLQVVQTVLDTTTSTTSTSHVDISGLSLSITPSSTSNKILVLVDMALSESTANNLVAWNLVRNSTDLAVGTSTATYQQTGVAINELGTSGNGLLKQSTQYLDSPSTTSATTYKIQWRTSGGTIYINRRASDTYMSVSSTITAMEISG